MTRTVTTLRKNTKYGYVLEAQFIQDKHDQGGITYSLRMIEIWDDGHITYPPLHSYERFNNKTDGNRRYLILRNNDGFELVSKTTFEPIKMDMR